MTDEKLSQAKHADKILTHYITLAMAKAGCNVDSDTCAELNGLITNAIEQAVSVAVAKAVFEVSFGPHGGRVAGPADEGSFGPVG